MNKTETVLICPLNWGLGHATRLVPTIRKYLQKDYVVVIAASGVAASFLKQEFPNLKHVNFSGISIRYFQAPFFMLGLVMQMPLFVSSFVYEYCYTLKLIKKFNPNIIVSDNRYGVRNSSVKSILITHQLFVALPNSFQWVRRFVHRFTHYLISHFNECQVPDYEDCNLSLSGDLSHGKHRLSNVVFIGPQSRFDDISTYSIVDTLLIPDVLVVVSGPEPHRSSFIKGVEERFNNSDQRVLLLCGKPSGGEIKQGVLINKTLPPGITKMNHVPTDLFYTLLKKTKLIIGRSGYSTIMDLHVLKCKAELIPTPNQTEQEYLANWLKQK